MKMGILMKHTHKYGYPDKRPDWIQRVAMMNLLCDEETTRNC